MGFGNRGRGRGDEGGVAPRSELAVFEEDGLLADGGGEFAELGASELDEFRGRGLAAPTLEEGERRKELDRRRCGKIDVDAERNGVARRGGGEVRWKMKAQHRGQEGRGRGGAQVCATKERLETWRGVALEFSNATRRAPASLGDATKRRALGGVRERGGGV